MDGDMLSAGRGASQALGLKAMMNDLGLHAEIEISTDAEAAKGIAARRIGKSTAH